MGTVVGPDIVTDGLVAVFDAGSERSYPGSGTTWYNLIGSVNGTLSTATIGTTTSGVMTFDGSDDSIDIPLASLASSDFTVIGVTQRTAAAAGRLISGKSNNWLLGQWNVYKRQYYSEGWVTGPYNTTDDLNTHIWCGTGEVLDDQYRFREDNVEYIGNTAGGSAGPNGFLLGRYYNSESEYGTGTITLLLVYNRVLTDAEITQNFNAQKNRFDI
jgi:hypothetical protein